MFRSIIAPTFTCLLWVAQAGQAEVLVMLLGGVGCFFSYRTPSWRCDPPMPSPWCCSSGGLQAPGLPVGVHLGGWGLPWSSLVPLMGSLCIALRG